MILYAGTENGTVATIFGCWAVPLQGTFIGLGTGFEKTIYQDFYVFCLIKKILENPRIFKN